MNITFHARATFAVAGLLFFTNAITAQSWQRALTVNGQPATICMAGPMNDGGAIVTGFMNNGELYVARLNADGEASFGWTLPHMGPEHIAQDLNGGFYFLGDSAGDKVLFRFNEIGDLIWARRFEVADPGQWGQWGSLTDIHQDQTGGAAESDHDYVLTLSDHKKNWWTTRIDPQGNVLWFDDHQIGPLGATAHPLALADGNTAVAGGILGSTLVVEQYNENGAHLWMNRYDLDATMESVAADMIELPGGELVVIASRAWAYNSQGVVMKLASDGQVIWSRTFGHATNDVGFERIIPWNSGFLVTTEARIAPNVGRPVIAQLDAEGHLIDAWMLGSVLAPYPAPFDIPSARWGKDFPGLADDRFFRIGQFASSDSSISAITMTTLPQEADCSVEPYDLIEADIGCTAQPYLFQHLAPPPVEWIDLALIPADVSSFQICTAVSTPEPARQNGQLVIAPNLTMGWVNVLLPDGAPAGQWLTILDELGQTLYSRPFGSSRSIDVDLGTHAPGIYTIHVAGGARNFIGTVVLTP